MPENVHLYQPKDGHQLPHDPFNVIMRGGGAEDYFSVSELQKFQLFRAK